MARYVNRSTIMYERISPHQTVRRQVFAGSMIPDHYEAGDDTDPDAFEDRPSPGGITVVSSPSEPVSVPVAPSPAPSQGKKT